MNATNAAVRRSEFAYLSTTIPYVNAEPHVGFALELVQADALARFQRLTGRGVRTSTGTDDHSLKNVRAAEAAGVPVREFVARNAAAFAELVRTIGTPFDETVETSRDPRHRPAVERLFRACAANGDVYRKRYSGRYCVGCEQFYAEGELASDVCLEHETPLELVAEDNWFFRLSRYEQPLRRAIEQEVIRVLPEERKHEVLGFIASGLKDFSISRSAERARGFGIPVPGDSDQVIYVWFDALGNYLSAGDYAARGSGCDWELAARRQHVLGKGVLRFHAVYWPAILLSAGLRLPDELRVHGYLTVEGKKIGKSAGNAIDPRELIAEYGADALRYYLLRHIPPYKDADFSRQRLIDAHDGELADELGNLLLRVLTLARQNDVSGAAPLVLGELEAPLEACARGLLPELERCFVEHELGLALGRTWELVREANRYLERTEPWRLAKQEGVDARRRLTNVVGVALSALRVLGHALEPFIPSLAARLRAGLGGSDDAWPLTSTSLLEHGAPLPAPAPLTPLVPRIRPSARGSPLQPESLSS